MQGQNTLYYLQGRVVQGAQGCGGASGVFGTTASYPDFVYDNTFAGSILREDRQLYVHAQIVLYILVNVLDSEFLSNRIFPSGWEEFVLFDFINNQAASLALGFANVTGLPGEKATIHSISMP